MPPTSPNFTSEIVAGIIGFTSAVLILIIAQLLKNRGKLTVNVNSAKITKYGKDGMGGEQTAELLANSQRVACTFEVDFYNSSDVPKSLRATTIELIPRNTKKSHPLEIYIPRKVMVPTTTYAPIMPEQMHILNLSSKEMLHLKLEVDFKSASIQGLQGKVDFFFQGKDPSGKTFRKKLFTEEF